MTEGIPYSEQFIRIIAKACHEVNRAYCEATGDMSQSQWHNAPDWQRESTINGVIHQLMNPNNTPELSHKNWLKTKRADGWTYGPKKDPEKKKHPCMVPYKDLPAKHKVKDYLFIAVVESLRYAQLEGETTLVGSCHYE